MRRAKRKGYNLTQAFAKQARRNENPTAAGHGEELLRESEGENQDWNDLGMVEDINFNNQDTVESVDDNVIHLLEYAIPLSVCLSVCLCVTKMWTPPLLRTTK